MRFIIFIYVYVQDSWVNVLSNWRTTHTLLFAKHVEPYRWVLGRWRVWRTYHRALQHVPAYKPFVQSQRKKVPKWNGLTLSLNAIPTMDKSSYIKKYSIEDRCYGGKLPTKGVVVDESSGSSGTPTSWVRGPYERLMIRKILQVVFVQQTSNKPRFILNAFSLGAWATGMNVSASLTDVSIIKSTGPDIDKIIHTIEEFGPNYSYVILGYPPFLKNLADDERIDLSKYDIQAGYGGEGMSENMRRYLLQSFSSVTGSYGASDLEINIAIEAPLAISLRQEIEKNEALAQELTRTDYGVLPMVFQYNPYDYVIESNDAGELLVSIARKENINPRIRYNIHDRGHVLRIRDLKKILKKHRLQHLLKHQKLDMPFLFHYGRSDLSVDYYGAVLAPDTVREVIYADPELARHFETYRLISYEDSQANKKLHIAIKLEDADKARHFNTKEMKTTILSALRSRNKDFDNACKIAKTSTLPVVQFYAPSQGPFREDSKKLKHEYVWNLSRDEAASLGLTV